MASYASKYSELKDDSELKEFDPVQITAEIDTATLLQESMRQRLSDEAGTATLLQESMRQRLSEQADTGEHAGRRGEVGKVLDGEKVVVAFNEVITETKTNVSKVQDEKAEEQVPSESTASTPPPQLLYQRSKSRSDAAMCRRRGSGITGGLHAEILGRWDERGLRMGSDKTFMDGAAFYDEEDEEYMNPKSTSTRVGLSYQIVKFHNIDVRSESFAVNFELTMQYKINESYREYYEEWKNGQYGKTFQELFDMADVMHKQNKTNTRFVERMKTKPPILEVRNAIETREIICERVTCTKWMQDSKSWDWWVQLYGQYNARCHEALELNRFPFTRQAFSVVLVAKQSSNNMVLVPFNCPESRPYYSANADYTKSKEDFFRSNSMKQSLERIGAWELETHHLAIIPSKLTPKMPSGYRYCRALLVLQTRQIPSNIMLNVFLLIFFLTLCGIIGVHIKPDSEDVIELVDLEMTVLLTMVAYKVSINEMLPDKPYLTWIDMYLVVAFFLVFFTYSLLVLASYKEHWNLQYIDFNWWQSTIASILGALWVWGHLPLLGLSIESCVASTQSRRLFDKAVLYVFLPLLAAMCYLLVLLLHLACLSLPDSRHLDIRTIADGRWFHGLLFLTWKQCMDEENKQLGKVRDIGQAQSQAFHSMRLKKHVEKLEVKRPLAGMINEVPDYYAVETIRAESPSHKAKVSISSKETELVEKPPFPTTTAATAAEEEATKSVQEAAADVNDELLILFRDELKIKEKDAISYVQMMDDDGYDTPEIFCTMSPDKLSKYIKKEGHCITVQKYLQKQAEAAQAEIAGDSLRTVPAAPAVHASHNSLDSFSSHHNNTPVQVLCYYGGLVASMAALIKSNNKEQWEQQHSSAGAYWREDSENKVPKEITSASIGDQVLGLLTDWPTFSDSCGGTAQIVQFLKTCAYVHKVPREDFNIVALVSKEMEQLSPGSPEEEVQQQIVRLKDQHVSTINSFLGK